MDNAPTFYLLPLTFHLILMSDLAIKVDNLSKRYRICARQKQLTTLRGRIEDLLSSPFDYLRSTLREPSEEEMVWTDEGLPPALFLLS